MKKYVIYGLGISGIAAAKFLVQNGEEVLATDDNNQVLQRAKEQFNQIKFLESDKITFDENTIIIMAPGIPLYFPQKHKILQIAQITGAKLICDIEAFWQKNYNNNFIGITGTNGKSTTTALTDFIFKKLKIAAAIGGNIGTPCFDLPQNLSDFSYIFEVSSYQLDLITDTRFNIAALLNITPDHIDRHGGFDGYIAAKKKIFKNQKSTDFALINIDNDNTKRLFTELKNDKNYFAKLIPISTKKPQGDGISLINGELVNNITSQSSKFKVESLFLKGEHNAQNMVFAFATTYCHLLQNNKTCDENLIINAIEKFTGLAHRMQFVGKIFDIDFINDSKATNAESTKNALQTYDNIFWIVGGKSKEGGIDSLQPYFNKIEKAYLIGESSNEFAKILQEKSVQFEKCGDLETAFKKAYFDAKNIGLSRKNVLLSPACASFDQWQNFEQRGNYFCKLFHELSNF